jgi:hypothetical protein
LKKRHPRRSTQHRTPSRCSTATGSTPRALPRSKASQSSEIRKSADLLGKLRIMAGMRTTTNSNQGEDRRSTRINANVTPGEICSSTDNRAKGQTRRPGAYQTVLQGSGEGEEATKKLLAIGSVTAANSHRPQGMRRHPSCNQRCGACVRINARYKATAATH